MPGEARRRWRQMASPAGVQRFGCTSGHGAGTKLA